jgi:hypothetical protein
MRADKLQSTIGDAVSDRAKYRLIGRNEVVHVAVKHNAHARLS